MRKSKKEVNKKTVMIKKKKRMKKCQEEKKKWMKKMSIWIRRDEEWIKKMLIQRSEWKNVNVEKRKMNEEEFHKKIGNEETLTMRRKRKEK